MPGADAPTTARVRALAGGRQHRVLASEREVSRERYQEQLALAQQLADTAGTADAWFNLASAT